LRESAIQPSKTWTLFSKTSGMSERPVDWGKQPLGEVAAIRVSNVDKKSRPGELPVRLCNYLDVYREEYLDETQSYMWATATLSEIETFGLRSGDVVITKDSETPDDIGVPAVIEQAGEDLVCGYHLAVIRPSVALNSTWLAKQLGHSRVQQYFARVATGTTRYALSNRSISDVPMWLPPRDEQDQVVQILRTLDKAIRKTENIIAKLQQMKQGLLHDLLTLGIDESHELRDVGGHPDAFVQSHLGLLPKPWEIRTLGEVADWVSGGTPSRSNPRNWTGVLPWVSPKDMKSFLLSDAEEHVSEEGAVSGSRVVGPGAVMVVVRGMILAHTFPVCLTMRKVAFNQDVKAVVPKQGLEGRFLAYWFLGHAAELLGLVTEATHGTKRLDLAELRGFPIAVPLPDEQRRIGEALAAHDQRLASEQDLAARLRHLKLGLAEDLLTGRVRAVAEDLST